MCPRQMNLCSNLSPCSFDLPPTAFAKPLPVGKASRSSNETSNRRKQIRTKDRPNAQVVDDTPRAFKRITQAQEAHGLKRSAPGSQDEGHITRNGDSKKRKSNYRISKREQNSREAAQTGKTNAVGTRDLPRIQPGEKMSDFSARVNAALPLTGIVRRAMGKTMSKKEREKLMGGERKTKLERKMQRIRAQWRFEEARRKEREEDGKDLADEADAATEWEGSGVMKLVNLYSLGFKKGKKGRRKNGDDDPWKVLDEKRQKPSGLHDVVQAPPDFRKVGNGKFKVKNGARINVDNVPAAAGSLRKREELADARRDIIQKRRQLMQERGATRM